MSTNKIELIIENVQNLIDELKNEGIGIGIGSHEELIEPPLDVKPYHLKSGPFKGFTALRWPCGSFVHNDYKIDPESVFDTYEFYGVEDYLRVPV